MPEAARKPPQAPSGLRSSGRAFWRSVHAIYVLEPGELPVLVEVCRVLDEIDALKAVVTADGVTSKGSAGQLVEHPALAGLRAHRVVLEKLLVRLSLPSEDGAKPMSAASLRAQRAAQSRWGRRKAPTAEESATQRFGAV